MLSILADSKITFHNSPLCLTRSATTTSGKPARVYLSQVHTSRSTWCSRSCYLQALLSRRERRHIGILACSHTVFRTPRACLRRELPGFQIPTVRAEQWEDGQWEGGRIETHDIRAVEKTMRECLIWIWLVLIDSWRATDGVESVDAMQLQDLLIIDFPECAGWDSVEIVLTRFFYTEEMRTKLKCSWRESTGPTMSTGEDSL